MLPLVLNDDLSRLIQINMEASVGQIGKNLSPDVKMIQAMLNNVPVNAGGPSPGLVIDGRSGPKTVAAIMRFQRAAKTRVADGRVDPAGPTIIALGRLLNSRGLMPKNVVGIAPVDDRVRRGLVGASSPSPANRLSLTGRGIPFVSPTNWRFVSSAGVSVGALIFSVAAMKFFLVEDSRPSITRTFPWSGFGVGLSTLPVGLDISFADMPSFGLRLRQGLFGSNPMPDTDIVGPCTVYSIGANLGVGFSGTLCMFGALGPVLASTRAIGAIAGMEVGIPSAGITGFFGSTGRSEN